MSIIPSPGVTPTPGATILPNGIIVPLVGTDGWAEEMNQNLTYLDAVAGQFRGEVYVDSLTSNGQRFDYSGATSMSQWLNTVGPQVAADKKLLRFGPGSPSLDAQVELTHRTMWAMPPTPKVGYKGLPVFYFQPKAGAFAGEALFRYAEPSLRGDTGTAGMCYLENFSLLGNANNDAAMHGFIVDGDAFGLRTHRMMIRNFQEGYWTRADASTGHNGRLHEHYAPQFESNAIHGMHLDGNTDSIFIGYHCHANGWNSSDNTSGDMYVRGPGDMHFVAGKHTFSERHIVTGDSSARNAGRPSSHSIEWIGGTMDRSRYSDIDHRAHGTRFFNFTGMTLGRGGRVAAMSGLDSVKTTDDGSSRSILVGVNDDKTGTVAPLYFDGNKIQPGGDDDYSTGAGYAAGTDRNNYTSPVGPIEMGSSAGDVWWDGGLLGGTLTPVTDSMKASTRLIVSPHTGYQKGTLDAPVRYKRHSMLEKTVSWGQQTWPAQPTANTRLRDTATLYKILDLTGIKQARIMVGLITAAPKAGGIMRAQYNTDITGGGTWSDLTNALTIDTNGLKGQNASPNSWRNIDAAAQDIVLVRIVSDAGNGSATVVYESIDLLLSAFVRI